MANNKHKFYNLLVVGPDMFFGHNPTQRPDYAFPEPGPDNEYHVDERTAPGYKLGSYLNVYNFDAIINKILDCDDWSTQMCPITRYVWDGSCHVKTTLGYETFLQVDKPESNNIPRNVYVLVQDKMIKSSQEPLGPSTETPHYHYAPTLNAEDKFRGWWISDELKEILETLYGWKFFEDVYLEDNFVELPEEQFTGTQWNGGIEKSFQDIQYHDLRIAINDEYNLSDKVDNRAMGDRIDVLALFSYAVGEEALSSLGDVTATLEGACEGDSGFYTNIQWNPVSPANPDISVHSYTLTSVRGEGESPIQLAEIPDYGQESFSYQDDLDGEPIGIPEYPKYFISWTADEGTKSPDAEITKLPPGFNTYGIPSCDGASIVLEKSFEGDCWTERYGELELSWNISLPPNTFLSSLRVYKDTTYEQVEVDVREYLDENVEYSGSETTHEYSVEAVVKSLATGDVLETITSNVVSHTIQECVCDDDSSSDCQTKCWVKNSENPDVIVWMENYIENPFTSKKPDPDNPGETVEVDPSATFDINYCIENQCSVGIESFSLRLKLPEGITLVDDDEVTEGVEYISDFGVGITKDEWIIRSKSDGSWNPAKPSYGTLCKIKIDNPIGSKRINFVLDSNEETGADGSELVLDGTTYDWDTNAQNVDATSKDWQLGPPLSLCTDEIDMGYGDYLINLRSIDLKTFDVNFCLSRDDFDTFFLVVLNTDFITEIEEVDPIVGQAVNAGWDVTFRNLSPGISVVMGNGTTPIRSSGYETLLRVKNNRNTPKEAENCICVFPFFLKLGGLWNSVKSIANNYGKNKNSVQASSAGQTYNLQNAQASYVAAAAPMMYSVATDIQNVEPDDSENMVMKGLHQIELNIDPRFSEIVKCLREAYWRFLQKINNPETASHYTAEQALKVGYSIQLFMSMISVFSTISIAKSEQINRQLDNIANLGQELCDNYISLDVEEVSPEADEFNIIINYYFPAGEVAGVQFQVNIPDGFVISSRAGAISGDAYKNKYLQVIGNNGGFLCVYDYSLESKPSRNAKLLSSMGNTSPSRLTEFQISWIGDGERPTEDDLKTQLGIISDSQPAYLPAKIVTNKIRTNPSRRWNGDWYNVDQAEEVNVRDFLVACILCSGGEDDLIKPDDVIVLPDGQLVSTKYFGGTAYDLSNINYSPTSWLGRDDDNFQEYVLDFFDANGDGVADISDVVTVRNLFLKAGRTVVPRKVANTMTDIVPTEVCSLKQTLDFEFYVPDECSDFCIQPGCFAKLWVSDIIPVKSQTSGISDILVEVSYAANCDGDDSLSGASFSLSGLTGVGIVSCVNGSSGTPTALKEYDWDFHLVSSDGSATKNTVIAHATSNANYVPSGTGVLTYLKIKPSAVIGQLSTSETLSTLTHTNSFSVSQSPAIDVVGVSSSHPMEPLYATFQATSEMLAFKRFGIKVKSFDMTTNSILEEVSESFDSTGATPSVVLAVLSEGLYKENYDANGDGRISLIDIQSAYHLANPERFNMIETEVVPTSCCVCEKPETPKLATASYITGDLELNKISGWGKDRRVSVDSFGCGGRFEGGVVVAWTPVEGAKYYTVYRKVANTNTSPVPVIGSKVGVIANRDSFKTEISNFAQVVARAPEQIDSTVWVDFPPPDFSICCDWCEDGDTDCTETSIEKEYEYYVVATNECGDVSSNVSTVATPCCNFAPKAESEFLIVEGVKDGTTAKWYTGEFDIKTKGGEGNVFVYTNVSSREDYTAKNGKFVVGSGAPVSSTGEFGNVNSMWYKYSPASGYFGPDKIKYFAKLQSNKTKNWLLWCGDESHINIFVIPPNPRTWGSSGDCFDDETRGTAVINWESVPGVTYYNLYRDGELIASPQPDETAYVDYDIAAESQDCDEDTAYEYAVVSVYVYNSQEFSPDPSYIKIVVDCCPPIENPQVTIRKEKDICNEDGDQQDGEVLLFWNDLGNFDNYKIYRKGGYDPSGSAPSEWEFIASLSGDPDPDGIMRFKDAIKGCVGCNQIKYDYAVTTVTISGEGELGNNEVSAVFDCCQSKPVAVNQTFVINDGLPISKQLLAYDKDADIAQYNLLSQPSEESGMIINFTDEGVFSFTPQSLFYGETSFDWSVVDECGNSDTATVTMIIKGQEFCKEDDYVICNAALAYLTDQQDEENARIREDNIPQVPFSLNNKSVPSLRKRCGAYSISQGVDPSMFALPPEGCLFVKFNAASGEGITVPEISIECDEDILFNSCDGSASGADGIPSTVMVCTTSVSFSSCDNVMTSESLPNVELEESDDNNE